MNKYEAIPISLTFDIDVAEGYDYFAAKQEAYDAILAALSSFYGTEAGILHPIETDNGVLIRAISLRKLPTSV